VKNSCRLFLGGFRGQLSLGARFQGNSAQTSTDCINKLA
jgi:hypothetical protein